MQIIFRYNNPLETSAVTLESRRHSDKTMQTGRPTGL